MVKKISNIDIAKINRKRIYEYIYFSDKKITMSTLVKELKLSRPTVDSNVKAFIESGFLKQGEEIESTGGRKPRTLEINGNYKYIISCYISYKSICIAIVNLLGEIKEKNNIKVTFKNDFAYFDKINEKINLAIKNLEIKKNDILGVSVVIPGTIDNNLDEVIYSAPLENQYIDIKYMREILDLSVYPINDVNAIGIARHFFKTDTDENKVYLNIARGIGGFIWTSQRKYLGDNGIAGEFGHMKIVPNGKPCHCSKKGCLEAYISTSVLSDELGISIEEFFERLSNYDEDIKNKWTEYLNYLAIGISNIYSIFNCKVVINSNIFSGLIDWEIELKEKIKKYMSFDNDREIYEIASYDEDDIVLGSCVHYINEYINKI